MSELQPASKHLLNEEADRDWMAPLDAHRLANITAAGGVNPDDHPVVRGDGTGMIRSGEELPPEDLTCYLEDQLLDR